MGMFFQSEITGLFINLIGPFGFDFSKQKHAKTML
jgi:hypothetical protein